MRSTRAAIAVRLLDAAADGDAGLVGRLSGLINEVYASAEDGLWREGVTRTTPSEVEGLIDAREIAVATLDGRLAGAIRVRALSDVTGEFGMLAADPRYRGIGVGRQLVVFGSATAATTGCRRWSSSCSCPGRSGTRARSFSTAGIAASATG
jgi:GNAT superfamily N-acetyltransferase